MASTGRQLHVGVLAYDGCLGTEIFGITDLFLMANRIAAAVGDVRRDPFRVTVVGRKRRVTTGSGLDVQAHPWGGRFDSLVVPGFDLGSPGDVGESLDLWRREIAYLSSANAAGVPVASVCVGAFLLGEAGLLDSRRATTSWLFARQLRDRYPRAIVDADCMIVSDGSVTTTAAFNAVHDLALRLIRMHAGDRMARHVARVSLVAENRNSQAPYVDDALLDAEAGRFARAVKRWLVDRLDEPYDLELLARAFNVSTRTMLRRFREEAGQSPLHFLQLARVHAAKRLLESPDHSVASAMESVGYADLTSFRRLFATHVGMTPAAYRRQFRGAADGDIGDGRRAARARRTRFQP